MKKLITLAAAVLMAVSAQAVTMTWGSTEQVYVVDENSHVATIYKNAGANGAIGLFYLGNAIAGTVKTPDQLTKTDALLTSSTMGTYVDENDSTFKNQSTLITDKVAAGDTWACYYIDLDTGAVSYWYTSADLTSTYNSWYVFTGSEPTASVTKIFGNDNAGVGKYVYVPVPEPASGALAFAGLAIMICRRKKQK